MANLLLREVVGGVKHIDMHPSLTLLAFNRGSVVILWDVVKDGKKKLVRHNAEVILLKFSEDGGYLFSINGGANPLLCIWISTKLVQSINLPKAFPSTSYLLAFEKQSGTLVVVESIVSGCMVHCWNYSSTEFKHSFNSTLSKTSPCNSIGVHDKNFYITERHMINLWNLKEEAKLIRQIPISQEIKEVKACISTKGFIILAHSGNIITITEHVILLYL